MLLVLSGRVLSRNTHRGGGGTGGGGHSPHILVHVGMCHGKVKNGGLRSELEHENAGL